MQLFKTDLIFLHPPQRTPYSRIRGRDRYGYRRRRAADAPCSLFACARCASVPAASIDFTTALLERAA